MIIENYTREVILQLIKEQVERLKDLHEKHTALAGALFFIGGFLFDILTLGRIDDSSNMIVLFLYLAIAYGIMILIKWQKPLHFPNWAGKVWEFREEIFHFLVGGVLSCFTIFYFKSSSAVNSLIFLFAIAAVLILNEIEYFQRLGITFKSVLLKISSTSFFIYIIPLIFKTNHWITFYMAIALSLGLTVALYKMFLKKFELSIEVVTKQFLWPRLGVLGFFLLFYWTNIMPPLPLSLTEIGVYYKIEKHYPEYHLKTLKPWWKIWHDSNEDFYARAGDQVHLFFKVFSPGDFEEKVLVEWYWYNPREGEWQRSDRIPLLVTGGREEGYRGITRKANYQEGEWRVVIRTESNLILGELDFDLMADTSGEEREFQTIIDN